MNLKDWTKHHLKFKDCFKKQIIEINELDESLIVHEKKEDKIYFINEKLDENIINKKTEKKKYIVTLNTKANVEKLIKEWTQVENVDLTIIFVNIKTNENWLINTKLHSKIAEKKAIKQGLISLYNTITTI